MNIADRKQVFAKILEPESLDTYSSVMRDLNKQKSDKIKDFMVSFKEAFDDAMEDELEDHQAVALSAAKKVLAHNVSWRFTKLAQAVVGISDNPEEVGRIVADIMKVILARMSKDKLSVYNNMRTKILNLNVAEISNTRMPDTAAYGQALTLIKTLLNGYDSEFVKKVLISASKYLY